MANARTLAVLTSGGDAPGMNAAIRAITKVAASRGVHVVGVVGGYTGLLEGRLRPLTRAVQTPGSSLAPTWTRAVQLLDQPGPGGGKKSPAR